ncbi:MAG: hypothetical protein R3Y68_02185 [Rikenellaceae bacterium]
MSRITTNYLRKEFYAARHNLRVKDLSWAILEISDDCECWRHPALKIRGHEAYIDVMEDRYVRFDSFPEFRSYTFLDAKLRGRKLVAVIECDFSKDGFYTRTIDMSEAVGRFYRFRIFDSPNFRPYKLNLDKSICDNLTAFLEEERAFEFFANRFWITKEQLSWGVLEISTDEFTEFFPVLRVNEGHIFIDIIDGEFSSCCSIHGRFMKTYPAYLEDGTLHYEKKNGEGFNHNITLDIKEILRVMFFNYFYLREK